MAKREMKTRDVEETKIEESVVVEKTVTEETKTYVTGRVIADGYKELNVRKNPKANAEVIDKIRVGSVVKILDIEKATGDWYKVSLGGEKTGYCMKKFIKLD